MDEKNIDNDSDLQETPAKDMDWLGIRARIEEACEVIFSFGGLCLTALIALGILPWGALGIGICATLAFIGITRSIVTNSWTSNHNFTYRGKNYFPDRPNCGNKRFLLPKVVIVPVISLIVGGLLTTLGVTGILSFSLGLSLGIPLLGSSFVGMINYYIIRRINFRQKPEDNLWGVCMGIFALVATATFLGLGFSGVLALPTAIALAAPLCILGVAIGLLTLFAWGVNKYGPEKLKGYLKDMNGRISCLGFGYFKDKLKVKSYCRNLLYNSNRKDEYISSGSDII